MFCKYCGENNIHDYRCPEFSPILSSHDCIICKENINVSEEYIENNDGEYAHWECMWDKRDVVKFLDIGIDVMEVEDGDF